MAGNIAIDRPIGSITKIIIITLYNDLAKSDGESHTYFRLPQFVSFVCGSNLTRLIHTCFIDVLHKPVVIVSAIARVLHSFLLQARERCCY